MIGENGVPECPDWHVDPKPNPFDVKTPTVEPTDDHLDRGYN